MNRTLNEVEGPADAGMSDTPATEARGETR